MCCKHGKVTLPLLKTPPSTLLALLYNGDVNSKNFRELLRAYNMVFSFTSLGGKVDHSVNNGKGPYLFQLHGENYHSIGDMLPGPDKDPSFLQLYMIDTINENNNRIKAYGKTGSIEKIKPEIVGLIKKMLDSHNPHVKAFRSAGEKFDITNKVETLKLRIPSKRDGDGRTHNLPTSNEVASLIPGDFQYGMQPRDVIIESRSGKLQRISELHPAYLPLQYPLLFPYGEDGFRLGIDIGFVDKTGKKRTEITMREFFAFRILEKKGESPTILMAGKLYQQFMVDVYTMIESNRLTYLRFNQKKLRCENYNKLKTASDKGDGDLSKQGQKIHLPASFVGGKRYMMQNYLDAMATCKYFGFPDLFITITCNPKWPEITRYLEKNGLKADERPDICCRVFKMKLDNLIEDLTKKKTFGNVNSAMYTIEFQKRGLPHAHIILFMHPDSKLPTGEDIDKIISAQIPDKDLEPELYDIVGDMMMHGPCGTFNSKSPCMQDGKCTKFFPKPFSDSTHVDDAGFPNYQRPKDETYVIKRDFKFDNSYVIPYNKTLSLRYRDHINVEWCNQTRAIKYLFKYIHKGPHYVRATIRKDSNKEDDSRGKKGGHNEDNKYEINKYLSCRYISACEATWRIFAFNTHFRTTPVEKLPFHLPDQQMIVYEEDDSLDDVVNRPSVGTSKFLGFMDYYKKNPDAKKLTYADYYKFFFPLLGEPYYLRVLLNIQPGPTCFEDIRTVNKVLYPVFTHGQLYVAVSRVTSRTGLKILITDKEGQPMKKTHNVVFKEVFQNLK